jgi:hypothetical protein
MPQESEHRRLERLRHGLSASLRDRIEIPAVGLAHHPHMALPGWLRRGTALQEAIHAQVVLAHIDRFPLTGAAA